MTWETIISLISSVGFPIVACVVMFQYMGKQDDKHREDITRLQEIIENNTKVMNELVIKINNLIK